MSFREDGQATLEWVARYLEDRRELPVLSRVSPGEIRAQLPATAPDVGEPFSAVLADLDSILLPGITHWNHPRFFAYFGITASEPGILAELLIAALNQNAMLWRTSPAATELEQVTLGWLADLLGLPASWNGHIEDGASTSTLAALATARHVAPQGRTVVYCSEHAHSSVDKACRLLGLEVRKVGSDGQFRMQVDGLDLSDAVAVVATVGTTSTTSVDPVPAIADLCAAADVWLHVDASYAGSAMVCEEFRWALAGCERADSLVVNPHKWMFTPIDCSALFTSRPDDLRDAFSLVPEYLRTSDEDVINLMDYGPALGRRFRSLKLWAVLRVFGREGLQHTIREHVRMAHEFERWVVLSDAWELVAPVPFSVVCFRRVGSDELNERLLDRVNAAGRVYMSHTKLHDRYVLRFAVGNADTNDADVRLAWDELNAYAEELEAEGPSR